MRVLVVLLILPILLVAGCSDGAKPAATTSTSASPAPPATATEETGAIEGTIVDDETRPIVGADIAILDGPAPVKSDVAGKFSFSELAPGTYEIHVQKLGYETDGRKLEVKAGEITNITVQLVPIAIEEGYPELLIMNGHILLSTALSGAAEGDLGLPAGCDACFFYWNATADVEAIVLEVTFVPTLAAPTKLYTQVYASDSASGDALVNEELDSGWKKVLKNTDASPFYQFLGCGVTSLCYEQRFTEYVTLFHKMEPADDYTAIPPE